MPDTTFGARLRQLREAAGLTQAQLAEAVGLFQPNVARYEAGERMPSYALACLMADALGVPVDALRQPPGAPVQRRK
jgi:transcriptional regulator with XRE-family HTH domain